MAESESTELSPPVVGTIRESPGDTPGLPSPTHDQDATRAELLRIYRSKGVPFLEELLDDDKASQRVKFDAVKLLQQAALPPPQPIIGDIDVTIVVDL